MLGHLDKVSFFDLLSGYFCPKQLASNDQGQPGPEADGVRVLVQGPHSDSAEVAFQSQALA